MYCLQFRKYSSFLFASRFWWKTFIEKNYTMHSMSGLGTEATGWFFIKSSIYTHIFILWIKGGQSFRNFMCNATYQNSFGLGWTSINEVHSHILYILEYIFVFLHQCIYNILCWMLIFCFSTSFWWKGFVWIFYTIYFMSGLGKESKIWSCIKIYVY